MSISIICCVALDALYHAPHPSFGMLTGAEPSDPQKRLLLNTVIHVSSSILMASPKIDGLSFRKP